MSIVNKYNIYFNLIYVIQLIVLPLEDEGERERRCRIFSCAPDTTSHAYSCPLLPKLAVMGVFHALSE